MQRLWFPLLVPVAVVGAFFAGRNLALPHWQARELVRLSPGLDHDFALHVVSDSDPQWISYCRRVGFGHLGDAYQSLGTALQTRSYPEFLERRHPLERAVLRIGQAFTHVYDFGLPERGFRRNMLLSPERDFHFRQLERRYVEVEADTSLSAAERVRIVDEIVDFFFANGDVPRGIFAYLVATRNELEAGRADRHRARLEEALRMARRYGQRYAECQVLGELGAIHGRAGRLDSLRICLDEGLAVALRHGFLEHAARMHKFYAAFYAEQGRLALALDHLEEAQRLCDRPQGGPARLRLHIDYTKFVADLGCWDLVDRSLRRLPPLLREFPRAGREVEYQKHGFDADRLRARLAFATGADDRGSLLMRDLSRSVPAVHRRVGYAELFDEWSAALEKSRPAEALEICDQGLAHCDTAHVPEHQSLLLLRRARLLEALGRTAEAVRELDHIDRLQVASPRGGERTRREIDVLRARVWFRQGRLSDARREIRNVLRRFRAGLGAGDGGPLSYLELDEALTLRDAVHEIERFAPEEGYDFEMEWRALTRKRVRDRSAGRVASGIRSAATARSADTIHLVFRFTGNRLQRWTATSRGVVLDTLPIAAPRCLEDVRAAVEILRSESPAPGAFLGPRALQSLRPLSDALLPRALLTPVQSVTRLCVSADGPLLALPFEALPVNGPRGEQPLAIAANVTYLRGTDAGGMRADGPVVIVSNPTLSPELLRRHGWDPGLMGTVGESQAGLVRWPEAVVFSGDRATREAILRTWPGASIIYLAAHHVRDSDAPLLGFVPLATPPGTSTHEGFLEVADIHGMDLSSCRLAILASCASGAPYRLASRPGVSLGDAVLDAGAQAVVESFWDVGDLETSRFMKVFLETWHEDGDDAAALNAARRQIMATREGAHPRVWAAWSLHEAGLRPPSMGEPAALTSPPRISRLLHRP